MVLLELLTGRRALGLVDEIKDAIEDDGVSSFGRFVDDSCGWTEGGALDGLRNLALACVERRPGKRPQSAGDLLLALRQVQEAWVEEHGRAVAAPAVADEADAEVLKRRLSDLEAQLAAARSEVAAAHSREQAAAEAEEETATCVVSYEEGIPVSRGLRCDQGHLVSDEYTDQLVSSQNEGIVVDDPTLGKIVDLEKLQRAGRPDGSLFCPKQKP